MADVNFIIKIEQDCTNDAIIFSDITDNGGSDGYGNVGTNERVDVIATQFTIKKPDGTTYSTGISGYMPVWGAEMRLTPQIFNSSWTTFDDMNYAFTYSVFINEISTGAIAVNKTYMVYNGGGAGFITYNAVKYYDGETFIGTSTTAFSSASSAKVTLKQDYDYSANILYWCNVKKCIKNLMMK